jgi:hypothetical protein
MSSFGIRRCHFVGAPGWFTIALTISAVVGSTERALRLRYNRWLDPAAS